ncbi:MAG TPA: hypothetical protein VF681_12070 [Abditibacteriaceae bacterium]
MALRIGKKTADDTTPAPNSTPEPAPAASPAAPTDDSSLDDWSDFGNIPNETEPAAGDDWTNFDDLVVQEDDANIVVANSAAAPAVVTPPAAPIAGTVVATPVGKPKKSRPAPSKALLGGLAAVVLLGGGAAAFLLTQDSAPEGEALPLSPRPKQDAKPTTKSVAVAKSNAKPAAKPTPTAAAKPVASPTPSKIVAKKAPARRVVLRGATPGDMGIAQKDSPSPNVRPAVPGQPPTMVPVQGSPTPLRPVSEPSAVPGKLADPNSVGYASAASGGSGAGAVVAATPTLAAKRERLKALWNQGAAAKRRGDKTAARRAWQSGLKQAEAAPRLDASAAGFRGSLAKL